MQTPLKNLTTTPQSFDFFQAVRLLAQHKNIRFSTLPALHFPVSSIHSVNVSNQTTELQVTFLGLFGPHGLLPNHYTELVLQRLHVKDFSLRDFLNVFNHRMISLFYKTWEKHHFFASYEQTQSDNNLTTALKALIGNGTAYLQDRSVIADESLLFYAGYFTHSVRSASNLENILSDFFDLPIAVKQFQGKWLMLNAQDTSKLSCPSKSNGLNQLGKNAVIGQQMWDEQNHFRIKVGPLNYRDFENFLPNSICLTELVALTQRYVGNSLSFDVQLILQADEVPFCRLRAQSNMTLGWNTWLKSGLTRQPVADTVLRINRQ